MEIDELEIELKADDTKYIGEPNQTQTKWQYR